MTTQLARTRMDLPPPALYVTDKDRTVAWLAADTLGFLGFRNEREAMKAAWIVHRTVSGKLARLHAIRPTPIDLVPLSLSWQNDRELIIGSGRPVAGLLRPGEHSPSGPDWFGFEIVVTPPMIEQTMREVLRVSNRALRKSETQWAIWADGRGLGVRRAQPRGLPVAFDDRYDAHREHTSRDLAPWHAYGSCVRHDRDLQRARCTLYGRQRRRSSRFT